MLPDLTVNSDYATLKQTAAETQWRDIQNLLYSRRLKRRENTVLARNASCNKNIYPLRMLFHQGLIDSWDYLTIR